MHTAACRLIQLSQGRGSCCSLPVERSSLQLMQQRPAQLWASREQPGACHCCCFCGIAVVNAFAHSQPCCPLTRAAFWCCCCCRCCCCRCVQQRQCWGCGGVGASRGCHCCAHERHRQTLVLIQPDKSLHGSGDGLQGHCLMPVHWLHDVLLSGGGDLVAVRTEGLFVVSCTHVCQYCVIQGC